MSHTPGPWEVKRLGDDFIIVRAGCDLKEIESGREQPIALLFRYSEDDARLIVTAPRMFDALSAALYDATKCCELSEDTINAMAEVLAGASGRNVEENHEPE